jgi:uncharacterized membrane protein
METNGIVILVLWVVFFLGVIIYIVCSYIPKINFLDNKMRNIFYLLFLSIIISSTFSYSVYLAHTDKNNDHLHSTKAEWKFSAAISGVFALFSIMISFMFIYALIKDKKMITL